MVGCVIAAGDAVVGEGWHQQFGGPHAEVNALEVARGAARDATMYVTLEPCCHQGKTPPCTAAIVAAGVRRVVCAMADPFPAVSGKGIAALASAGIEVEAGLLEADARLLNAPYLKRVTSGRPWVIAKWAMTLDGRIATATRDSRWISGLRSRAVVHRLRGRMDAIIVGSGTARCDDPLLSARPPGPRTATRVVVDSKATLASDSRLVHTVKEAPVLVATGPESKEADRKRLEQHGCEVLYLSAATHSDRIRELLDELGRRQMTNVLVEGGGGLLGSFFDTGEIDEVHAFIAPKIAGGASELSAIGGLGVQRISDAVQLVDAAYEIVGDDVYVHGRVARGPHGDVKSL
jgi:diaminohydroxyphosphoribosylaminopyrimidine deaminase/5-amino-6-(5-phosphoribosylamino)uracil reductase